MPQLLTGEHWPGNCTHGVPTLLLQGVYELINIAGAQRQGPTADPLYQLREARGYCRHSRGGSARKHQQAYEAQLHEVCRQQLKPIRHLPHDRLQVGV